MVSTQTFGDSKATLPLWTWVRTFCSPSVSRLSRRSAIRITLVTTHIDSSKKGNPNLHCRSSHCPKIAGSGASVLHGRRSSAFVVPRNDCQHQRHGNPPPGWPKNDSCIDHHECHKRVHASCQLLRDSPHSRRLPPGTSDRSSPANKEDVVDIQPTTPVNSDNAFCHVRSMLNRHIVIPVMPKVEGANHMDHTQQPCCSPETTVLRVWEPFSKQPLPQRDDVTCHTASYRPQHQHFADF